MEVVVRGRHAEVSERFRSYAQDKVAKLDKLAARALRVDAEISRERNPRLSDQCYAVELTVTSKGPVIRAEARAEDPYAAFDAALAKLSERLRRAADRRRVHHGTRTPVSVAVATSTGAATPTGATGPSGPTTPAGATGAVSTPDGVPAVAAGSREAENPASAPGRPPAASAAAGEPADRSDTLDDIAAPDRLVAVDGDGPMVIREKVHRSVPMTLDQALYEMELVGHDFFVFVDKTTRWPCVVYRRRGYDYGLIRLDVQDVQEEDLQQGESAASTA